MTSLLAATAHCWVNDANQPILRTVKNSYEPFTHIHHLIEPVSAPGRFLTPNIVGIVYCEMLRGVFEEATWPGHVHAEVYQAGLGPLTSRSLGKMDIVAVPTSSAPGQTLRAKKDPLSHTVPNLSLRTGHRPANDSASQTPTMLRSEPIDEKVWLELFTRLMFWTFRYPWNMRLSERLVAGPYRFLSLIDNRTCLILTITPYAVAPGAPFQWITLMREYEKLLVQTAMEEKWETLHGHELRRFLLQTHRTHEQSAMTPLGLLCIAVIIFAVTSCYEEIKYYLYSLGILREPKPGRRETYLYKLMLADAIGELKGRVRGEAVGVNTAEDIERLEDLEKELERVQRKFRGSGWVWVS
ncbi:MAG: hypothetical protein Q9208_004083 [Pyrenodesmia sp. 3 TL-2023]